MLSLSPPCPPSTHVLTPPPLLACSFSLTPGARVLGRLPGARFRQRWADGDSGVLLSGACHYYFYNASSSRRLPPSLGVTCYSVHRRCPTIVPPSMHASQLRTTGWDGVQMNDAQELVMEATHGKRQVGEREREADTPDGHRHRLYNSPLHDAPNVPSTNVIVNASTPHTPPARLHGVPQPDDCDIE